jgi:hypothetical protein
LHLVDLANVGELDTMFGRETPSKTSSLRVPPMPWTTCLLFTTSDFARLHQAGDEELSFSSACLLIMDDNHHRLSERMHLVVTMIHDPHIVELLK